MDEIKNKTETSDTKEKAEKPDPQTPPKEIGGRDGPDPVRYGDWENNGIASDF
ncbi:DUF1674 domain-containing protein [Emcibacter sp.]|uniref:DUF1674 domain-containing protein n=1 Tax=Emcibacter sp. TaxID=1979954 RepID=UPI002AA7F8AB|nr:DUF1674 domain-containing protein [Emcibacter sp.]